MVIRMAAERITAAIFYMIWIVLVFWEIQNVEMTVAMDLREKV